MDAPSGVGGSRGLRHADRPRPLQSVNDTVGHAGGDEVLRAVGHVLRSTFREADACGRYGGDELACLAPGMPVDLLVQRADEARRQWALRRPAAGAGVGFSVGVAAVGPGGPRAALRAADRALYRVKKAGRNHTAVATGADQESEGT